VEPGAAALRGIRRANCGGQGAEREECGACKLHSHVFLLSTVSKAITRRRSIEMSSDDARPFAKSRKCTRNIQTEKAFLHEYVRSPARD
jgi:hypothetical protein